jgi:hypothetical protein
MTFKARIIDKHGKTRTLCDAARDAHVMRLNLHARFPRCIVIYVYRLGF